jgi:hypothetical protein
LEPWNPHYFLLSLWIIHHSYIFSFFLNFLFYPAKSCIFMKFHEYQHAVIPEHFHHSITINCSLSIPLLPLPPGNNLLSVFKDLPIVDISCKWYHTMCDILCVPSIR